MPKDFEVSREQKDLVCLEAGDSSPADDEGLTDRVERR